MARRQGDDGRAPRRVAAAALLRGRDPTRVRADAARRAQARPRGLPRGAARDRCPAGRGSAVRGSRPALGNRLQRMGSAMVRGQLQRLRSEADAGADRSRDGRGESSSAGCPASSARAFSRSPSSTSSWRLWGAGAGITIAAGDIAARVRERAAVGSGRAPGAALARFRRRPDGHRAAVAQRNRLPRQHRWSRTRSGALPSSARSSSPPTWRARFPVLVPVPARVPREPGVQAGLRRRVGRLGRLPPRRTCFGSGSCSPAASPASSSSSWWTGTPHDAGRLTRAGSAGVVKRGASRR